MVTYTCPDCDKKFEVYSSMYSHKRIKHSDPKIACGVCNKMFHTHQQLYQHAYKDVCERKAATVAPDAQTKRASLVPSMFQQSDFLKSRIWGEGNHTPTTSVSNGLYRLNVAQS